MSVYIYMSTYTYMATYIYTCPRTLYIYMFTNMYLYMSVYVHAHLHVHVHVHVCLATPQLPGRGDRVWGREVGAPAEGLGEDTLFPLRRRQKGPPLLNQGIPMLRGVCVYTCMHVCMSMCVYEYTCMCVVRPFWVLISDCLHLKLVSFLTYMYMHVHVYLFIVLFSTLKTHTHRLCIFLGSQLPEVYTLYM